MSAQTTGEHTGSPLQRVYRIFTGHIGSWFFNRTGRNLLPWRFMGLPTGRLSCYIFNISSLSGKVTLLSGADTSGQLNGHKEISVEPSAKHNLNIIF